jgi:hypothetical protein
VPATKPAETTVPTADQDVLVDELSMEIAWGTTPADEKAAMCEGYHLLDADQFTRLIAAYAPDLPADMFMALLDKEC